MRKYLLILLVLASCTKDEYLDFDTIRIPAGKSSNMFEITLNRVSDRIDGVFIATPSWYYTYDEIGGEDMNGLSKIDGLTDGDVHDSSARITYKCVTDEYGEQHLMVYGYVWRDGVSPQEKADQKHFLTEIIPDKAYRYSILREGGMYKFSFDGVEWECLAGSNKMSWRCNPYIGGRYVLKHDWVIHIKRF